MRNISKNIGKSYYPFGGVMPGRTFTGSSGYRFGFNGMEHSELEGDYTTTFRPYNSRLGRWYKIDPKAHLMAWETPYSFALNMPIYGTDTEGDICIPCVIAVIGFLTAPAVAVAPTGNPKDAIAIQNAYDLQSQWILNSAIAGNGTVLKELGKQFVMAVFINGSKDIWNNGFENFDPYKTLYSSYQNLDYFDAMLGQFELSKTMTLILSSTIDISPEEANFLFNDKSIEEVTIDGLFTILSNYSENKIAKGKYHKYFKSLLKRADETVQKELNEKLKEFLGEEEYNEFQNKVNDMLNQERFKPEPLKIDGNNMYKIEEPVEEPVIEPKKEELKQG